jgi:hypothetical protein
VACADAHQGRQLVSAAHPGLSHNHHRHNQLLIPGGQSDSSAWLDSVCLQVLRPLHSADRQGGDDGVIVVVIVVGRMTTQWHYLG